MTFVTAALILGWMWTFTGSMSAMIVRVTEGQLPVWAWMLLVMAGPFSLLVALVSGVRNQDALPHTFVEFLLKKM